MIEIAAKSKQTSGSVRIFIITTVLVSSSAGHRDRFYVDASIG